MELRPVSNMCESVFKVLVIGASAVGKTAFVARYCTKEWLANYKFTLGGKPETPIATYKAEISS